MRVVHDPVRHGITYQGASLNLLGMPVFALPGLSHPDGSQLGGGSSLVEVIPPADQYAEQADAFAASILEDEPGAYGLADGVRNMKIIDALLRSESRGGWESTGL